jgi:hypothetical protein
VMLGVVNRFIAEYFVISYLGDINILTVIVPCFLISSFVLVVFIILICDLFMGLKYRGKYY